MRGVEMGAGTSALEIQITHVEAKETGALREVVALADQFRGTVGFMPQAAFGHAASAGTLVAAIHDGRVVGYALYALPRQVVRLTHLCVAENMRSQGVARLLIDEISERHGDRFGITLKCRKDYKENKVWPRLGFESRGAIRGRSKHGYPLEIWWKDHGHPSLFSLSDSLGMLRVALDLNVFVDLDIKPDREGATESRALADDWLADQVELVVTPELRREVARLPEGPEKERHLSALKRYRVLSVDTRAADAVTARITDYVRRTRKIDLSLDQGDASDVRHVAEAGLAGVTVLATRDANLLRWSAAAADAFEVRVMRPADVVLDVDELARAQAYQPVQLQDTAYRLAPVRARSEDELLLFLNGGEGEQKPKYLSWIRPILAGGQRWARTILRNPDGNPIAFYVTGAHENQLEVPVLRVIPQRLENTIARQLIYLFREEAMRQGCPVIKITDPCLANNVATAIRENGFIRHGGSWIGLVIRACGDASTVDALAASAAQAVDLRMPALRPGMSAAVAADLERALWPGKIIDSDLPTFLVPIRPAWASDLFGVPQTMFPRSNMLGISREHVYYRSPRPRVEQAPARLLWYVSGASHGGTAAVIGCSRLDEVVIGKPVVLHQTFRHLGVWHRDQVTAAAHDGVALALRFADTEIFPHQVSLRRLRELAAAHRQNPLLRSPQKITADLFAAIYQEGQSPGDGTRPSLTAVRPPPLR
jgi:GNAT superfamily N-acetyltransferase